MLFRITVMEEEDLIKIIQEINSIRTDIKITLLDTETGTFPPNQDILTIIIQGIPTSQEVIIKQILDIHHIQITEETPLNLIHGIAINLLEHTNQETFNLTFIEAIDQYKIIFPEDLLINGTIIQE